MADLTPHRRGLARQMRSPPTLFELRRATFAELILAGLRPLGFGAAAFTRCARLSQWPAEPKLAATSPAFALWASARQPSLATRATMACQAEARGNFARLRPLGFGAAAFTRYASDDGLPSRSSRQLRPPSPFGLRRGSLHSLRERRWPAKPKLAAASPAFALWASARQPSLATRDSQWPAKPKLAAASPAFALWASARQPSLAARAKAGGARRSSTADLLNAIQALSQLSYGPFRDQTSGLGNRGRGSCSASRLLIADC